MHKNELFFDLVFLVTPLDPPKFTPSPIPPLEVGPLAILATDQVKRNYTTLFGGNGRLLYSEHSNTTLMLSYWTCIVSSDLVCTLNNSLSGSLYYSK